MEDQGGIWDSRDANCQCITSASRFLYDGAPLCLDGTTVKYGSTKTCTELLK